MFYNETYYLRKWNMFASMFLWGAMCVVSMAVMLLAASHKEILLVDNAGERVSISEEEENAILAYSAQKLNFNKTSERNNFFSIPLEKNIRAGDIVIDNRYTDQQLRIYIRDADYRFYEENAVSGDISGVLGGECLRQSGGVVLIIHLNGVFEYKTTMSDDRLIVERMKMTDAYRMVVVIDPLLEKIEAGTEDQKLDEELQEIALSVALAASEKINVPEIKVLVTRFNDAEMTIDERVAFTKEAGADIYLALGLDWLEDREAYGISGIYNAEYFIPEFGNLELADLFTREVTIAASNRAVDLYEASDDSILKRFAFPAAQIQLGNIGNEQEKNLLLQKEYQNMLADGIVNAIMKTYEDLIK